MHESCTHREVIPGNTLIVREISYIFLRYFASLQKARRRLQLDKIDEIDKIFQKKLGAESG